MFIDLKERGREREKHQCEREISIGCPHMCHDQGLNPQPFSVWNDAPVNRATQPGLSLSSLLLNLCFKGPHRLDPRNQLPAHFSQWPSAPHIHPFAYWMSLLSVGAIPVLAWCWEWVPHSPHLPHLALFFKLLKSNRYKTWTRCHSKILSEPTFSSVCWEWPSWGRKNYGAGNGCTEASKDTDNVPLFALHSEHIGVYLL